MDGKNLQSGMSAPPPKPDGREGTGSRASSRQYRIIALVAGLCLVIGVGAASAIFSMTSSTEFCTSCHEMALYKTELALSPHAKDYDGKPMDCKQCHIPPGFGPRYASVKTYLGVKDLYVHFVDNPQTLDRQALQPAARRFVDDGSCLSCHEDLYKNAKKDGPISTVGKISHDAYRGLDGKTYRSCADCHPNMAHLPVFDRRLDINKEFAAKIAASEQEGGGQ